MKHTYGSIFVAATLLVVSVGCSDSADDEDVIRSSAELASALVTVDDLDGEWTLNEGPQDGAVLETGEVTEAGRDKLPTVDLCDAASNEAKAAADELSWQAYRQLDKTEGDPVDPPTDREGHVEFVQEFLMSDNPDTLSRLFDDVASGFVDCLGDIPAGEEGPGTAVEVDIDPMGDQRIAVLATIEEAGGGGMWHVYSALVRRGAVLVSLVIADVVLGDLVPELTVSDVNDVLAAAVSKL